VLSRILSEIDWNINVPDVQQCWNLLESKMLFGIDVISPYTEFYNNKVAQTNISMKIKTLLNARKNLQKKFN
jgi:hypothetical protein